MSTFKKTVLFLFLIGQISSCKKSDQAESTPTYFVQVYAKEDSQLARSLGKEFGTLQELKSEFITNDSSAYIWAWRLTEKLRGSSKGSSQDNEDLFSSVSEFKLYDENGVDITKRVSFEGIENYPNPFD